MGLSIKSAERIQASSGNVFADLNEPDAAELDTKVRLAVAINRQLKSRRLTQAAAGLMRDADPAEFWCRRPDGTFRVQYKTADISQRGSVANSMKEAFRPSCSIRVRAVCVSVSSILRPPELRLRS